MSCFGALEIHVLVDFWESVHTNFEGLLCLIFVHQWRIHFERPSKRITPCNTLELSFNSTWRFGRELVVLHTTPSIFGKFRCTLGGSEEVWTERSVSDVRTHFGIYAIRRCSSFTSKHVSQLERNYNLIWYANQPSGTISRQKVSSSRDCQPKVLLAVSCFLMLK